MAVAFDLIADGLTVTAVNHSTTGYYTYQWSWGDGTPLSYGYSPLPHTYANPGSYQVTLIGWTSAGYDRVYKIITVSSPTNPLPVASFTRVPTAGPVPLTVVFTNTSQNATSYLWDFGDGTTSTETNPSHVYTTPGTYMVQLTATGPNGTHSTSATVTVNLPTPSANFTLSSTTGPAPLTVVFTNTSQNATSYLWIFGDGTTSTEVSPTHVYNTPGTYNVALTAYNSESNSQIVRQIVVTAAPVAPIAVFTPSETAGVAPLWVNFANQSSNATDYSWDFGDGTTSAEDNPSHSFNAPGLYTVTLTATGPGGTDTASAIIEVQAPPDAPVAGFTPSKTAGVVPLSVHFANTSQNATSFYWDFGDGTTSVIESPEHVFTEPGNYTVRLTAAGPGGTDEATADITAEDPPGPPEADFSVTPWSAPVGTEFSFLNASHDATSYLWDFGDGATSTETDPVHPYATPGLYTVQLTATGPGGTDIKSLTVLVTELSPVAAFTANPQTVQSGQPVSFVNYSLHAVSYEWVFGDGATSNATSPSHVYTSPGNYTVTLRAIGPGGEDTETADIEVQPEPVIPWASFGIYAEFGPAPLTVPIWNESIPGPYPVTYFWDFGDGRTSTDEQPGEITYDTPGRYDITLTVTNAYGQTTDSKYVIVEEAPMPLPIANFQPSQGSGVIPLEVVFTNESQYATSYLWNFGDGTTSTEVSPTHVYSVAGTYQVVLTAYNSEGSHTQSVDITAEEPTDLPYAEFDMGVLSVEVGVPVVFANYSQNATGYFWEFGDGATSTEFEPTHIYTAPGSYEIRLTVTGPNGSDMANNVITVTPGVLLPTADFTPSTTSGDAPLRVFFENHSQHADSYYWEFGDGETSEVWQPIYYYPVPGVFTARLTVYNQDGSDTMSVMITVTEPPPPPVLVADFSMPATAYVGEVIHFVNLSQHADSYIWAFKEGVFSQEVNPSYAYDAPGVYPVLLRAMRGEGADEIIKEITILEEQEPPPEPDNSMMVIAGGLIGLLLLLATGKERE